MTEAGFQTLQQKVGTELACRRTYDYTGGAFPAIAENPRATARPSSGVTRHRIRLRPLGIALPHLDA